MGSETGTITKVVRTAGGKGRREAGGAASVSQVGRPSGQPPHGELPACGISRAAPVADPRRLFGLLCVFVEFHVMSVAVSFCYLGLHRRPSPACLPRMHHVIVDLLLL